MIVTEFHYLTDRQSDLLLSRIGDNSKYRLITLLMMDAGLRVSEAISLQFDNLRFREKLIRVRTLKKRNEQYRDVPMSSRIMETMAKYLGQYKGDKNDGQSWLFPSQESHLGRKAVWAFYDRMRKKDPELKNLHPHALRHTFATRLVNSDVNLLTAKELLGHGTIQTTEIYTHIPSEVLRNSIKAIEAKPNFLTKLYRKMTGYKSVQVIRLGNQHKSILVGREKELIEIQNLSEKMVNILIKGQQGVGKSQLLDNIDVKDRKVVRMDEIKSVKTALTNFALHVLGNDKKELCDLLFESETAMKTRVTKDSTKNLVDLLIRITEKGEYTVIIDDVTDITPTGVKVLELMRNHFHIIAAARNVKIDKSGFLTNFQMIEMGNLKRAESLELIHRLSFDVMDSIEDYELYKNHIWEQTNGNPQFVYELIERYRKEEYIANETVREIRHNAANPEIDFTPVVLVALGSLILLRYLGRELGEDGYQLIGGIALVFALFARQFFRVFRRRFV